MSLDSTIDLLLYELENRISSENRCYKRVIFEEITLHLNTLIELLSLFTIYIYIIS